MKKRMMLGFIVLFALALFTLDPGRANAFSKHGPIYVFVDGKEPVLRNDPIIKNGTTMIELRPVFEMLGMEVHWDQKTNVISGTKDKLTIKLKINDKTAYVNGKKVILSQVPTVLNGRTLVPLRFVAEASGKKVFWDGKTRIIIINEGKFTDVDFTFSKKNLNKDLLEDLCNGKLGPFHASQTGKSLAEIANMYGFPDARHDGTPESDDIPFMTYGDYLLYYSGGPGHDYLHFPVVRSIHIMLPKSTTNQDIINVFGNNYEFEDGMYLQMVYKFNKYNVYVQTNGEKESDHPYFLTVGEPYWN
ncbi:copper amine oxidase N-terminal domain-containing protein [Cytobacillus depressus]|uniref:Copper amine oxidase N-terminal domain-containing protein n=1 Tax=Cytobacillus depressus TaxID=1602942 RepID=A0A6L3V5W6_9BACI|nr:copper amine oxidase N-terminal domain-containing protein [Cytobacillus depressus]KAB2336629.1 copper amine oxidase N-terminal domain-containing protein [Cytobacillus depressus]